MAEEAWTVRKLTHEQAREEQRTYWASKTVAERLAACHALTKRMYMMRGIDLDELKTDLTLSRVSRTRG
jgi:hypothetical protein